MGIKHHVNEEFFEKWSPIMAYVLGYYYADGSLENAPYLRGKYVRVSSVDESTIIKIRNWLSSEHNIRKDVRGFPRKDRYLLRIGSHVLYDSLISRGVEPNKSKTMVLPQIPGEFLSHFVRGYFDGDGCVHLWRSKGKNETIIVRKLSVIFTSGSKIFLLELGKLLQKRLALRQRAVYDSQRAYQLRYSTKDSIQLFKFMYYSAEQEVFLKRKVDIFKEYFLLRQINATEEVQKILKRI